MAATLPHMHSPNLKSSTIGCLVEIIFRFIEKNFFWLGVRPSKNDILGPQKLLGLALSAVSIADLKFTR